MRFSDCRPFFRQNSQVSAGARRILAPAGSDTSAPSTADRALYQSPYYTLILFSTSLFSVFSVYFSDLCELKASTRRTLAASGRDAAEPSAADRALYKPPYYTLLLLSSTLSSVCSVYFPDLYELRASARRTLIPAGRDASTPSAADRALYQPPYYTLLLFNTSLLKIDIRL